ncbi:hypothetical protein AB0F81_06875 [Actinoplanes sp. NPDC024001]|uniref:hypothetical protein n=1 Tax=Actinoplanes sp. NPDC024001 TaxID=3154598 RepID=UPI0033FDB29B
MDGVLFSQADHADQVAPGHIYGHGMDDGSSSPFMEMDCERELGEPPSFRPVTAAFDSGAQAPDLVVLAQQDINDIGEGHCGLRFSASQERGTCRSQTLNVIATPATAWPAYTQRR